MVCVEPEAHRADCDGWQDDFNSHTGFIFQRFCLEWQVDPKGRSEVSRWCKPPVVCHHEIASPGRGGGLKITFIKLHGAATQHFQILIAKCARAMMFRLLFDVMTNRVALGSAHR